MKIGQFDSAESPLVIAEIGNNHEGDVGLAEELLEVGRHAASLDLVLGLVIR